MALTVAVVGCIRSEATRISEGLFVVHAKGAPVNSQGDVIAEVYQEAARVCPAGFQVEDKASASNATYMRTLYGVQQLNSSDVTLLVRCNDASAAAPAQEVSSASAGSSPWWCTYVPGYPVGHCDHEPSNCEDMRAGISSGQNIALPACFPRQVAYCHREQLPSGLVTQLCAPTDEMCRFGREHAGDGAPLSECTATR